MVINKYLESSITEGSPLQKPKSDSYLIVSTKDAEFISYFIIYLLRLTFVSSSSPVTKYKYPSSLIAGRIYVPFLIFSSANIIENLSSAEMFLINKNKRKDVRKEYLKSIAFSI